jgi:hypothetical protein
MICRICEESIYVGQVEDHSRICREVMRLYERVMRISLPPENTITTFNVRARMTTSE